MQALLLLLLLVSPLGAQKRFITETDLYRFVWLGDPQMSPDGSEAVYVRVTVNAKKTGYETDLWIVPTTGGAPRRLTNGPNDASPRWSPDGKTIAFTRGQPSQIYLLPRNGGEPAQMTSLSRGAGSPVWSPDGKSIAFTSTARAIDEKADEEKSDVRVITRASYRSNGAGYRDLSRPQRLWVQEVAAGSKPKLMPTGKLEGGAVVWSPDGTMIYYVSNPHREPEFELGGDVIQRVVRASGQVASLCAGPGDISGLAVSPDGQQLAYTSTEVTGANGKARSYNQGDLFVCEAREGARPRNLTAAYDFDIAHSVSGDQAPPRAGGRREPVFSADGRSLLVTATEEGRQNLKRVDVATGKVSALTDAAHSLYSFSSSKDGARAAVAISTPTNIGDLFLLTVGDGKLTRLTDVNEALWKEVQLTEPAMIWTKSFDGRRIQSWVQRPPDFVEGRRYPVILNIHGGPHVPYGYTFSHEFQWMAAKGYVVLYPNPRGSSSYGQEFGNIIQFNYPGDDHKDLMAALDDVLARGWGDAAKQGVTGGSGGGVLTNWAVGQTDRFRAAVSQRSIADWTAFWYTADFTLFRSTWFRAAPWEDEADFKRRSPITYVNRIKTPMLFIEGEADLRTPPTAGGEQMFRALKYRKVPTAMVQFPGESHELSRSGRPTHRVERLQHIVEWFEIYLMGKDSKAYEVR